MDILIIANFITEFKSDGTSRFIYIAEKLSQEHNVELITSNFDHRNKQKRKEIVYDLPFEVTMLPEFAYKKNVSLKRFFSHSYFGKQVKKYLKLRKKPDVIYCAVPSLDCAYYAGKYAKKNNIKFIIDIQDLWPEAFKMVLPVSKIGDFIFLPMKIQANMIYSYANAIVGVSETYCDRAYEVNKNNADCLSVFLGTQLKVFDNNVKENKVIKDNNKFVLGYCGTLGHSYDIKCVLDAMIILKEKGYNNISFWIIGDGPLRSTFESYAREKELDAVFYGLVPYEKMCGLLASCDVCINPIIGTSVASIINKHGDYAAVGLPVINTQSSCEYRELIEAYHCGINCEPSNPKELSEAIEYLITHKDERLYMGKQSRILAEEKFDRDVTYQRIIDVIT